MNVSGSIITKKDEKNNRLQPFFSSCLLIEYVIADHYAGPSVCTVEEELAAGGIVSGQCICRCLSAGAGNAAACQDSGQSSVACRSELSSLDRKSVV